MINLTKLSKPIKLNKINFSKPNGFFVEKIQG